jgi:dolichol-phosphate mannosyltransferase
MCGALSSVFNILVLATIIKLLDANTPVARNIANLISIEISLLFSFIIYRMFVWKIQFPTIKLAIFQQLIRYHLSVSASIISRASIVFPLLDWLGFHYSINTLIGIILGSIITYTMTDKWVFKNKAK